MTQSLPTLRVSSDEHLKRNSAPGQCDAVWQIAGPAASCAQWCPIMNSTWPNKSLQMTRHSLAFLERPKSHHCGVNCLNYGIQGVTPRYGTACPVPSKESKQQAGGRAETCFRSVLRNTKRDRSPGAWALCLAPRQRKRRRHLAGMSIAKACADLRAGAVTNLTLGFVDGDFRDLAAALGANDSLTSLKLMVRVHSGEWGQGGVTVKADASHSSVLCIRTALRPCWSRCSTTARSQASTFVYV